MKVITTVITNITTTIMKMITRVTAITKHNSVVMIIPTAQ